MKTLSPRDRLHPYPTGWYVLDRAHTLAPGELRHGELCGQKIVWWRGESGAVAAVDAYCPHMGAHLGHDGIVVGDDVRCPFHHFTFGGEGSCTHAPGFKPGTSPPLATLRTYPLVERWGYVMVWFDEDGGEPTWDVPVLDGDWTPPAGRTEVMDVHPADVAENAPDVRHFQTLHHNTFEIETFGPLSDHEFQTLYRGHIEHGDSWFTKVQRLVGEAVVDTRVYGVGLLNARITMPSFGAALHFTTSPRPLDAERTAIQVGVSLRRNLTTESTTLWSKAGLSRTLPLGRLADLIISSSRWFIMDAQFEDVPVWANKVYYRDPTFLDPSVRAYRKWVQQHIRPLDEAPVARSAK